MQHNAGRRRHQELHLFGHLWKRRAWSCCLCYKQLYIRSKFAPADPVQLSLITAESMNTPYLLCCRLFTSNWHGRGFAFQLDHVCNGGPPRWEDCTVTIAMAGAEACTPVLETKATRRPSTPACADILRVGRPDAWQVLVTRELMDSFHGQYECRHRLRPKHL